MTKTFDATSVNFQDWGEFFHENGYIILENAISPSIVEKLRKDLENENEKNKKNLDNFHHTVHKCFFEKSKTTTGLVTDSILFDFAQYIIADVPGRRGNNLDAHLIHNNAFSVPPGGRGQAATWHTDDALQNVIIPEGKTLPKWIKLPVMVVTYMIWLSDCETEENGPTYVVPGSHRFGTLLDKHYADLNGIPTCGKAGTAILINNQLWHRGCENTSNSPRHTLQLTFARRIVGHKFKTIMNYQMPSHVLANIRKNILGRFGFLAGGAYS